MSRKSILENLITLDLCNFILSFKSYMGVLVVLSISLCTINVALQTLVRTKVDIYGFIFIKISIYMYLGNGNYRINER